MNLHVLYKLYTPASLTTYLCIFKGGFRGGAEALPPSLSPSLYAIYVAGRSYSYNYNLSTGYQKIEDVKLGKAVMVKVIVRSKD